MLNETGAEEAIRRVAADEGITAAQAREQIQLAMLAGLRSEEAEVRARWSKIPCKAETPTPEELIAYISAHVRAGTDPFE